MVINNKLLWTNVVTHVMIFTARQQGAVLAIGLINPSVCLSVCRSHVGIVSKWVKLWSCGLHWRIAPWLDFFVEKLHCKLPNGTSREGRHVRVGQEKIAIFSQNISCSTSVQDRTIVTIGSPMRAFDCNKNHRPWMTLNGRYAFICRKDASFGSQYKNFNEGRPILSAVPWATNPSGTAKIGNFLQNVASFLRYF